MPPPEIIHSVLTHISSETDIANFRLVQHSFADLGAKFLFRIIHIDLSKSSLSRLVSLSSSSNLARYVKTIFMRIHGKLAIIWPEYIKTLDLNGIDHRDMSERAEDILHALIDSFNEFLCSGDLAKGFGIALRGFLKLKAVTVNCTSPYRVPALEPRKLAHRRYYIWISKQLSQPMDLTPMFINLIDILYLGNVKLDSFEILDQLGTEGLETDLVFRSPETIRRDKIVFRNCKSITLPIKLDCGAPAHLRQGNPLFLVLAPVEKLEKLHVVSYIRNHPKISFANPKDIPFPNIFGTEHVWPKLKTVAFPSITMHANEVVGFLSRHKATLRKVSMERSILRTGSWVDVMRFIKQNMKLVKLNISQLEDPGELVYSDEEKDMIAEYVLGGGQLPERANPHTSTENSVDWM